MQLASESPNILKIGSLKNSLSNVYAKSPKLVVHYMDYQECEDSTYYWQSSSKLIRKIN